MKSVGVIGLGDMGSGLAKNLIKNGFETFGYDLLPERMKDLQGIGGKPAGDIANFATIVDAIFIMVMNGNQVKSIL